MTFPVYSVFPPSLLRVLSAYLIMNPCYFFGLVLFIGRCFDPFVAITVLYMLGYNSHMT